MFCPACGTKTQNNEERCANCGASLFPEKPAGAGPLEPPQGRKGPDQSDDNDKVVAGRRIARLGDRLLAIIIDGLLIMAVFAVVGTWIASRWGGMVESGFSMTGTPALIAIGLTTALAFLYFWFMEGLWGATLGKLMSGIKVRDISGAPCSLSQSIIRNILRIVDGIALYFVGFLIALFSKLRQRLGDHIAKTVVVEKATGKVLRVLFVLIWLASIIGCGWGAYMIYIGAPPQTKAAIVETAVGKTGNHVSITLNKQRNYLRV